MKNTLTSALLLFLAWNAFGQSKNSFGINVAIAEPDIFIQPGSITGRSVHFDLRYFRTISRKIKFETGLGWQHSSYSGNSHSATPARYTSDFRTLYVPLFIRYNFSRYFFIHGGPLVDIDTRKINGQQPQSGLGLGSGLGLELMIMKNWVVQINPFINFNPLWFSRSDPAYNFDRGFRIGIRTR